MGLFKKIGAAIKKVNLKDVVNVVKTGVSFVPVVGTVASKVIDVGQNLVDANKQAKEAEKAQREYEAAVKAQQEYEAQQALERSKAAELMKVQSSQAAGVSMGNLANTLLNGATVSTADMQKANNSVLGIAANSAIGTVTTHTVETGVKAVFDKYKKYLWLPLVAIGLYFVVKPTQKRRAAYKKRY